MCPFLSANYNKNKNIKLSKKDKSTLSFCTKSTWCVAGIFAVINDGLWQPGGGGGGYIVLV